MDYPDLELITHYAQLKALRDAQALTPAEEALLDTARTGGVTARRDKVPKEPTPETLIRAPLLRFLVLGGCPEWTTDVRGISIRGAWIRQDLNLSFGQGVGRLHLRDCRFEGAFLARQFHGAALVLNRSIFPQGVDLHGSVIAGDLLFRGVVVEGGLTLMSAQAGGQVDFDGASLVAGEGDALNAQGLVVGKAFFWRDLAQINGMVRLTGAKFNSLADDAESWERTPDLMFDGLRFVRLSGPTDIDMRLAWLERGAVVDDEFRPHPYAHFAEVMRETGHTAEARRVMMEKERLQRSFARKRWRAEGGQLHKVLGSWIADHTQRWLVGYGYRPLQSVAALLILIAVGTFLADRAWRAGDFAPNAAPVLMSSGWQAVSVGPDQVANPAEVWSGPDQPGRDYETFEAFYYSVDLVIPLISLGQEAAWAPSTTRGPWGWWLWWVRWWLIAMGWIVTAIGAAAVTGIIRKE
ncbi:hypothetical protein AB3Y40_18670 [Yoonia sp. R2331]|uniref:hypothetical protein n=1 Tax=Yoonia sp. R2331 TaxID=3237238 RepID=UPI0034E42D04